MDTPTMVHRHHQAESQLQGVPHVLAHIPGKEKADDGKWVDLSVGIGGSKNAGQGVEAGQKHKAEEKIYEYAKPDYPEQEFRLQASLQAFAHFSSASSPECS